MRKLTLFLCLLLPMPASAQDPLFAQDQRILFLGDSNTFAGHYITYVDSYLRLRFPQRKFELINLGLPSETVSGLSEPDHPFPRPTVHERLERALDKLKPTVVIACYGMNDGMYYPFSEERFAKFKEGILKLRTEVEKRKARLILMSSVPFDPLPLKGRLQPLGAARYSWMKPYSNYDETLQAAAQWLLTLRKDGLTVVDVHTTVTRYLEERRARQADFTLANDGIHPNKTGHWLVARRLLLELRAWSSPTAATIHVAKEPRAIQGEVGELQQAKGGLTFTWQLPLPLPFDPAWEPALHLSNQRPATVSGVFLAITGLKGNFALFADDVKLGVLSDAQLAKGYNLLLCETPLLGKQRQEFLKAVQTRQQIVGLAWLSDVGHKRPQTPRGIALEEVPAAIRAAEAMIAMYAGQKHNLKIRLEPVK